MTGFHIDTGAPQRQFSDGIGSFDVVMTTVNAARDRAGDDDAAFDRVLAEMIVEHLRGPRTPETVRRRFWAFREQIVAMSLRSPDIHDELLIEFLERLGFQP